MDNTTATSFKNSVELRKISLPFDSWKIIIEYLNDEDSKDGFGSTLPYRAINKLFSKMILECIRKVKITIDARWGDSSGSILKRQKVNDTICRCKGLRSLHISIIGTVSFCDSDHEIDLNEIIEELRYIESNCKNIEELSLKAEISRYTSKRLPKFPNLRKLTLKKISILPPSNMRDMKNLQIVEGDLLESLWFRISTLPNLKEFKWSSDMISNQNITHFCNQSKGNSICETLEVLGLSSDIFSDYHDDGELTDDGLYLVLDTFPNLRSLEIQGSDISLAGANIPQKLGTLTQLKELKLTHTSVFTIENSTNIDSIYELLEILLKYLPKSLEVIEILNCRASSEYSTNDILDSVKSKIRSRFYILPNLREMSVTFDIDYYSDDEYDGYGGIELYNSMIIESHDYWYGDGDV
jgi:hypothetical protein